MLALGWRDYDAGRMSVGGVLRSVGVLTSVATYHPDLDFATICNGYADGLSTEDIQSLGESLLPHARLVAEQVSAQWVMDVCHEDMARSVHRGDIA